MYITKDQALKITGEFFGTVKNELSEKSEFMFNLLDDDDWSFVIKSHSLIEAIVTELVVTKIDQAPLKALIERMPLHGETVSKISMAKIYHLLSAEHIRFIIKLSEIRNSIVHKYENINFTFDNYINGLDKNNRKNWDKLFETDGADSEMLKKVRAFSKKDARTGVWLMVFNVVNLSLFSISLMKGSNLLNGAALETTSLLLKERLPNNG